MTRLEIVQKLLNICGTRRMREILPPERWGVVAFGGGGLSGYVEAEDGLVWFDITHDGEDFYIPSGTNIHFADSLAEMMLNNAIEMLEKQLETLKRIKDLK